MDVQRCKDRIENRFRGMVGHKACEFGVESPSRRPARPDQNP